MLRKNKNLILNNKQWKTVKKEILQILKENKEETKELLITIDGEKTKLNGTELNKRIFFEHKNFLKMTIYNSCDYDLSNGFEYYILKNDKNDYDILKFEDSVEFVNKFFNYFN